MNLVLTMAGKYTRFKSEGYSVPKYLLPWRHHTILREILSHMHEGFDDVFLIANEEDSEYRPHVVSTLESLDIPRDRLIYIGDTSGQAETAYNALQEISNRFSHNQMLQPVVFHNIDTVLYNRDWVEIDVALNELRRAGYIDVFRSSHHQYSYVLTDDDKVVTISEKVLISDMATSGLYGFVSGKTYMRYYTRTRTPPIYISDIYRAMIDEGEDIVTSNIVHDEKDTWVLGTPQEYMNLSRRL